MKSFLVLNLISMMILHSCFQNTPIPIELEFTFGDSWKADSIGCNGSRARIVEDSLDALKQCEGRIVHEVFSSLGFPNAMYKRNQGVMLSYFVTCGEIPKDKLSEADNFIAGVNTEAAQLILETDTFLVVKDVKIIVP